MSTSGAASSTARARRCTRSVARTRRWTASAAARRARRSRARRRSAAAAAGARPRCQGDRPCTLSSTGQGHRDPPVAQEAASRQRRARAPAPVAMPRGGRAGAAAAAPSASGGSAPLWPPPRAVNRDASRFFAAAGSAARAARARSARPAVLVAPTGLAQRLAPRRARARRGRSSAGRGRSGGTPAPRRRSVAQANVRALPAVVALPCTVHARLAALRARVPWPIPAVWTSHPVPYCARTRGLHEWGAAVEQLAGRRGRRAPSCAHFYRVFYPPSIVSSQWGVGGPAPQYKPSSITSASGSDLCTPATMLAGSNLTPDKAELRAFKAFGFPTSLGQLP